MLQLISIVMVIYSYFLIRMNLPHLPQLIPTHYNGSGVADGWGSPETLWVLLAAQALTCAVFLLGPYLGMRNPASVHVGSRRLSDFPPAQRTRMLAKLNDLAGYLSIVMNVFFVYMLRQVIHQATQAQPHLSMFWPLGCLLAGTAGIAWYYLRLFRRAARSADDEES